MLTKGEISLLDLPEKVREKIIVDPETGCWLWQGEINRNGYGRVYLARTDRPVVHRWIYEQLVDEIPEGHVLDHLCRVRSCCNPSHMEPVTVKENTLRGKATLFKRKEDYER